MQPNANLNQAFPVQSTANPNRAFQVQPIASANANRADILTMFRVIIITITMDHGHGSADKARVLEGLPLPCQLQ